MTTEAPRALRTSPRWMYAAALTSFMGALLSKSVTASLPAAIVVLLWWQYGRVNRRQIVQLIPFVILGVVTGLHTAYLEMHHVGATGADWNWSFWERCLIAGRVPWHYLGQLIWPHPLIFIYPKWAVDARDVWQWAWPVSVVVLVALCWWQRYRWGRGPLAAVLLFGGTLFPVLGFANVFPMRFSFVADHFQYLADIGLIVLAVSIGLKFGRRLRLPRIVSLLTATGILLALGGITFLRSFDYRDRETLWTVTMLDNPDCWLATWIMADIRFGQGRIGEAALYFDRARELKLQEPFEPSALAELHAWSARCQAQMGNPRLFEHHRNECLKYMQAMLDDPFLKPLDAHVQRGILYGRFNVTDKSAAEFRLALNIDPLNIEGNCELGALLSATGQFNESEECYRRALQRDPYNVRANFELARLHQEQGKTGLARAAAEAALRIRPDFTPARKLVEQLSSPAS